MKSFVIDLTKEYTELELFIRDNVVPTFRTKKDALTEGKKFGWNNAIRVKRRFEIIWIVGKKEIQPRQIGFCIFDVINVPALKWTRSNSYTVNKVFEFKNFRKGE